MPIDVVEVNMLSGSGKVKDLTYLTREQVVTEVTEVTEATT